MRVSHIPVIWSFAVLVLLAGCGGDGVTDVGSNMRSTPAKLEFITQPDTALSGSPISPALQVAVEDSLGHTVEDSSVSITLALDAVDSGATLRGTATATTVSGIASFDDLSIATSGHAYRLTATAPSLPSATSAPFDVELRFASVSAGAGHTCGLTVDSTAYCWGDNGAGALGDGTMVTRAWPAPVAGGLKFASISAGSPHTCALTAAGAAYCWGGNGLGELGVGPGVPNSIKPMAVSGGIVFATLVADWHSCGLTASGGAYCWGALGFEFGADPALTDSIIGEPSRVSGGLSFTSITSGLGFTCGVAAGGDAHCVGDNAHGELGDGTTTMTDTMVAVSGGLHLVSIEAGDEFACGRTADSAVWCWGQNESQQLGAQTSAAFSSVPVQVSGGHVFSSFSVGGRHACGIATDGETYCWGSGADGQLGDGQAHSSVTPVQVAGGLHFTSIDAGSYHTCGIATDGFAYCWGVNFNGELGNGATNTVSLVPVRVGPAAGQ